MRFNIPSLVRTSTYTHTQPSDIWCPLIISFIIHAINMHILIAAHLQLEWYYLDISESNFGVRAISIYNSLFLWLPFLLFEIAVCLRSNDTKDDTRIPMTRSYYWHTAMNAKENIKKLKILCCHIKQIQFAHISCGKTYHRFLHQLNTHIPVDTVLCYVLISIRTISYPFIMHHRTYSFCYEI